MLTLKNSNEKIIVYIFLSLLAICFIFSFFNLPKSFNPNNEKIEIGEQAGTITNAQAYSGSFLPDQNNLRNIFFYFTTNIKKDSDLSATKISVTITDSQNNTIYENSKRMYSLKKGHFLKVELGQALPNSANREYSFSISLEKTANDNSYIAFWKDGSGKLIVRSEFAKTSGKIMMEKFYLFFPSFLMLALIIIYILREIFKKNWIGLENKNLFYFIIIPFLFVNALFYVQWVNHMAPIDEQSHFDVIRTIAHKFTLPAIKSQNGISGTREAFQPPLYYIASAPLIYISKNTSFQAATVRIWDVLQYLALIAVGFWAYLCVSKHYLKLNSPPAILFFSLFIGLIPALIVRTVSISNGTFSYFFIGLQLWIIFEYLGLPSGSLKSKKLLIWIGIVSGLSLLSRFTNIFALPVVLGTIALKEKFNFRSLAKMIIIIGIIISPWLAWNYAHYGALTPNIAAIEDQKSIVNPENKVFGLDFIKSNTRVMLDTISTAEEYGLPQVAAGIYIVHLIGYSVVISLILGIIFIFKNYKTVFDASQKEFFILIAISLIVLNVLQQFWVVIFENWPVLLGRYLHGILIPLAFLLVFFALHYLKNKKTASAVLGMAAAIMLVFNMIYLINIIQNFN